MADSSTQGIYATLDDLVRSRHRASGFSLLPRQPIKSLLAGRHASKLRGRGLNFAEIRAYLPGDDIRQIDWKVTARTRKPHARVFTEERERPVILVIDQRLGMFFGSQRNLKSVTAAEAAALAAWRTIAGGDRVGAVIFNDTEIRDVRPQRSPSTVLRMLQHVIEMNHELRADSPVPPAPAQLNEALRRARHLTPHDGLMILISDGDGYNQDTQRIVTDIAAHNDVLVVFVFDPLEGDLPEADHLVVSDGARQLELNAGSLALQSVFRQDFAKRRASGKHFFLTREASVLPLSAAEETVTQIARALGARTRGTQR